MALDLANLQNVALLVSGNQQRPLIHVRSLTLDDVAPQIVIRRLDVLHQTRVVLAILVEGAAWISPLAFGHLGRNGFFAGGPIDTVPKNVRVAHPARARRRGLLESRLQVLPINRRNDDEVIEHLHDAPRFWRGPELELWSTDAGYFVGHPPCAHFHLSAQMLSFDSRA